MGECQGKCQQAKDRYQEYLDVHSKYYLGEEKIYPIVFFSDDYYGPSSLPIVGFQYEYDGYAVVRQYRKASDKAYNEGHPECDGVN